VLHHNSLNKLYQTQSNLFNAVDYKVSMGATETQRKGENYNIWLVIGCGTKLQGYKATMLQCYKATVVPRKPRGHDKATNHARGKMYLHTFFLCAFSNQSAQSTNQPTIYPSSHPIYTVRLTERKIMDW